MESEDHAPPSRVRSKEMPLEVAAATHVGRRNTNADAFLIDEAAGFYAVADAMGDTPRSALVAQTALRAVREMFGEPWMSYASTKRSVVEAGGRLTLGVEQAHCRLYAPWMERERRIGTTFAGVVTCGDLLCAGHIGDSRIYLLRGSKGRLAQLTEDHTAAGEARLRGMRADEAARLPDADTLTGVIGVKRRVDLQVVVRRWEPGDIVLVCSDGVSDRLPADVIAGIMLDAGDVNTVAQTLVDRAVEQGGWDNATALLIRRRG